MKKFVESYLHNFSKMILAGSLKQIEKIIRSDYKLARSAKENLIVATVILKSVLQDWK